MRCVVVESPYAGAVDLNERYARNCVKDCINRGESPYASHLLLNQPGVLRDAVPAERALGMLAGLAWTARADATVFYVDLGWSQGMVRAFNQASTGGGRIEIRRLGESWLRLGQSVFEGPSKRP